MYNFVSIEDSNSRPLEQGMRGLFIEEIESGNVEGWVLDASTWTFNTFVIPSNKFVESNAPYLDGTSEFISKDQEWQCSSVRVVFDDVHCSKVTDLRPGDEVAFWGYRSDG